MAGDFRKVHRGRNYRRMKQISCMHVISATLHGEVDRVLTVSLSAGLFVESAAVARHLRYGYMLRDHLLTGKNLLCR